MSMVNPKLLVEKDYQCVLHVSNGSHYVYTLY